MGDPLYQYSWLILFAPLFAFAVIVFGTRVLDLLSRPRVETAPAHGGHEEGHAGHTEHHDAHDAYASAEGEHDEQEYDDNPLVPSLTFGARLSAYLGILIMAAACVYSWVLLVYSQSHPLYQSVQVFSYEWLSIGHATYQVAFQIDNLAIAMMVVVTTVSLLVQFYSQGYMANQAGYARFFSYLSLFAFSMLVIVFAQNFLVIFVGWELVGLSSYLLIGFWINKRAKPDEQRPSPASAALQAFVTNRVGDVGFILGIMILFTSLGTFDFHELTLRVGHMDKTLLTIAMILVFCGAIGKSAQLPLHVWLPSAMEGPTPVRIPQPSRLWPGLARLLPSSLPLLLWYRPTSSACWRSRPSASLGICLWALALVVLSMQPVLACSTSSRMPSSRLCSSWALVA